MPGLSDGRPFLAAFEQIRDAETELTGNHGLAGSWQT